MSLKSLIAVFTGVLLVGCTVSNRPAIDDRTLNATYISDQIRWRSGGFLRVYFKSFKEGEMLSLCGAYTTNSNEGVGGTTFNDLALQSMSISIEDKVIAKDLSFFRRLPFVKGRIRPKGNTSCVLTDIPWKAQYRASIRPEISISRKSFVIRN